MVTPHELGSDAIRIEQEVIKESVGCQDQIWAAYGGLNRIDFRRDGEFVVTPIIIKPERRAELQQSLMLFFTGFSRFASDFARTQIENVGSRWRELNTMQTMVGEAIDILRDDRTPIRELGKLLHESWHLKRQLAEDVSNSDIDAIYEAGRAAGAIGGKLLGAGGGGFMVFMVEPGKREAVCEALRRLVHVNFDFDQQGSKIVIYQPNGL